ncbi:MAG: NAD(+)/NADH kinase, partial [Lachnospiraceae bacterium]
MQRIGILINRMKEGAATMAEEIRRYLAEKGALGLITDGEGEIPDGISCLLVVGGDGTLLRAAKRVVDRQIPLLGINLGTLGYLAEVEAGNVRPAIDQLLSGRYSIEKRMMLEGEIERDGRR